MVQKVAGSHTNIFTKNEFVCMTLGGGGPLWAIGGSVRVDWKVIFFQSY